MQDKILTLNLDETVFVEYGTKAITSISVEPSCVQLILDHQNTNVNKLSLINYSV